MVNNDLSHPVPFQTTQPLISPAQKSKDVKSPSLSKTSAIPFPETPSRFDTEQLTAKGTLISDSLLQVLDRVLQTQAGQIETEFKELENQAKNTEFIHAILGLEGLGYTILNYTHAGVESGIEFLGKVLPRSILEEIPSAQKWRELGSIASLGAILLSSLDIGAQGVALICKHKILQESKKFLKEYKASYAQQLATPQAEFMTGGMLKAKKQKKIQKAIDKWELQIAIEEQVLKKEKLQFSLRITSHTLTLVTTPFAYVPQELLHQSLKTFLAGMSWTLSGIGILGQAVELNQTNKENKILNEWMESYQKWQAEHLPRFEITEKGAKRVGFAPRQTVIFTDYEHESALFAAIKTNPLSARAKLKECGVELPSTMTKKGELLTYLKSHPDHIQKYIHFQRQLESLNAVIYTSENLLEKRKAVMEKKVLLLKPRFNSIEPQIRERQKQAFVRDMQLKETLPTDAIDQHFEKGFETQKKENLDGLIRDYIDHQETIEQTTKGALKQMVQQKHELESRFQKLKLTQSKVLFSISAISFTASAAFAILGLLSFPVGGAGVVLLALSIGSITLSTGFFTAGYIQSMHYKPQMAKEITFSFQIKMAWTKLRAAIASYSHQSKEKKLVEVAKILQHLHQSPTKESNKSISPEYQKALADYQQAKFNFAESQKQVEDWTRRLKKFESQINEAGWKDFSQYADLPIGKKEDLFDTLTAFQAAFQACDLRLLNAETRNLLEMQLGINLESLQVQMKKDPEGIKKS